MKAAKEGPIPMGPISKLSWAHRVRMEFQDLTQSQGDQGSALSRLGLLKRAIIDVTKRMQSEDVRDKAVSMAEEVDDKLGWTMRLLRACEKGHHNVVHKCFKAYPALTSVYSYGGSLEPIRQHAVFLNRSSILQELHNIQREEHDADSEDTQFRRSKIQARLKKLRPGHCSAIGAIMSEAGVLLTILRTSPGSSVFIGRRSSRRRASTRRC